MKTNKRIVLLATAVLAFCACAEGPVLRLKAEQMDARRKAKENCGKLEDETCKKRFGEILTPEQRKFYAVDDKYDTDGEKKPDPSTTTTEFRLSECLRRRCQRVGPVTVAATSMRRAVP